MKVAGELTRKTVGTEGISDALAEMSRKSQVNEPQLDETLESLICLAFADKRHRRGNFYRKLSGLMTEQRLFPLSCPFLVESIWKEKSD